MAPYLEEKGHQPSRSWEHNRSSKSSSKEVSSDSESELDIPENDEMELLTGYALGGHHSQARTRKRLNGKRMAKSLLALVSVCIVGLLALRFSITNGRFDASIRIGYVHGHYVDACAIRVANKY